MTVQPVIEDDCPHCSPRHGSPNRCAWGVRVGTERDSDNQPVRLWVEPTSGAHVAQADATWLWWLIRLDHPVLTEIAAERSRQDAKWGEQNHADGTSLKNEGWREHVRQQCQNAAAEGRVTWAHILQEEFVEALAEEDPAKLRAELLQTAAVCVAWMEAIDRRTAGQEAKANG